jgi:hypothetical protein
VEKNYRRTICHVRERAMDMVENVGDSGERCPISTHYLIKEHTISHIQLPLFPFQQFLSSLLSINTEM